jgi:hypothetical protein
MPELHEPPKRLTAPYGRDDPSLYRQGWENADTHRSRMRARKTKRLVDALGDVELTGYESRCLTWVAAWETHMVATLAVLIERARAAGYEAGRERNCNDNCNDADQEQVL